jgi:hypothetical protein
VSDRPAWFEYTVSAGRLTAMPVHWKGWAAMMLVLTVPTLVLLAVSPRLRAIGEWAPPLGLLAVLAFDFTTLIVLVKRTGRRARR